MYRSVVIMAALVISLFADIARLSAAESPHDLFARAERLRDSGEVQKAICLYVEIVEKGAFGSGGEYVARSDDALQQLHDLSIEHAEARNGLARIRGECLGRMLNAVDETPRREISSMFRCVARIDEAAHSTDQTVSAFKSIIDAKPQAAESAYLQAESALIAHGEYGLCGNYIDVDAAIARARERVKISREVGAESSQDLALRWAEGSRDIAIMRLSKKVAVLVKCGRQADAERMHEVLKCSFAKKRHGRVLDAALDGVVPDANTAF